MTDARNHWAATWIMTVVRAGIIDPFDNHTFQPRALVRRTDLALADEPLAVARSRADKPAQGRSVGIGPVEVSGSVRRATWRIRPRRWPSRPAS